MTGATRRDLASAAGLLADLHPGPLPLDPHPRLLVDAILDQLLDTIFGTERPEGPAAGTTAAVGALAGFAVRSPFLAAYLTAGAGTLAARALATGDHLLLDPARPDEPEAELAEVATALTARVIAPAIGAATAGAVGSGAAYALFAARTGRPAAPVLDPAVLAPCTVLAVAAARPRSARSVLRGSAAAARNGAPLDLAAVGVALGIRDGDGASRRDVEAGDLLAASRLVGDVALVLALALAARGLARSLTRVVGCATRRP